MKNNLSQTFKNTIISNPKILGGKPIIAGTRISVETIIDLLSADLSISEILKEYPQLTSGQIKDALTFITAKLKREKIIPIELKNGEIVYQTA